MKVGPRIVITVLIIAIYVGVKDSLWTSFYETFLVVNGINWMLKLVSKNNEKKIMARVLNIEKKLIGMVKWAGNKLKAIALATMDSVLVTLRCLNECRKGRTFPQVLDV